MFKEIGFSEAALRLRGGVELLFWPGVSRDLDYQSGLDEAIQTDTLDRTTRDGMLGLAVTVIPNPC